ncbi:MAG: insulinase family protein, partial [Mesorhizobium sp.]|nr:insulinase family protein [Mesorhizobium sp.]
YGKPVTMEELLDRLSNITIERLSDLSSRLFATTPSVAAIGPIGALASYDSIRSTFSAPARLPQKIAV